MLKDKPGDVEIDLKDGTTRILPNGLFFFNLKGGQLKLGVVLISLQFRLNWFIGKFILNIWFHFWDIPVKINIWFI